MADKESVVRFVVLVASLLTYFGVNTPESTIEAVSYVLVGVLSIYTAYKNNYLFSRGKEQKKVLQGRELYEKNK